MYIYLIQFVFCHLLLSQSLSLSSYIQHHIFALLFAFSHTPLLSLLHTMFLSLALPLILTYSLFLTRSV